MNSFKADALLDLDLIEEVSARLDLRQPNREALESIVFEMRQHYEIEQAKPPFVGIVDVATGVGKTYIMAAAIDFLVREGVRNFAVITPGRTILTKTVANFTLGNEKSLLGNMDCDPVIVTSDNFNTASMRAVLDDPNQIKLYVFTVQALTKPQTTLGRRTHKFQEGLGEAFYEHLQGLEDLVVFADEHHTYFGTAFSETIRDLQPKVLVGLTATPHRRTPAEQIIYKYPLAAAIADKLVKTPVLVGRRDDRTDPQTKLMDGVRLLELKERAVKAWSEDNGKKPVRPVMLVVAKSIAEAEEVSAIFERPVFAEGRYQGAVLTVHSDAPDDALSALAAIEDEGSPYRIIISVGMLKEGWDVKNVYVIASMRASVSEILTEQTLGRGLRLPFGKYTGIEVLDTLEVLGHEKYEELLKKAGVFNEQFIDRRTRAVLKKNADGELISVLETTTVSDNIVSPSGDGAAPLGKVSVKNIDDYITQAEAETSSMSSSLGRRSDVALFIPRLRMATVTSTFSLADITDLKPFKNLGERIAADPVEQLRRVTLGARVVEGPDGLRRTELVTTQALDKVESQASLFPLESLRLRLIDQVLGAPVVPARPNQRHPASVIVDAFINGLGANAEKVLSSYMDRAAARLILLVNEEHKKFATKPSYSEVIELTHFNPSRLARPENSKDRFSVFKKGVGYEGYQKSLFSQDWFDSSPERDVANILEDDDSIALWVRLQTGDLPILWAEAREYNPDLIAIDKENIHWLIEVKMDREMTTADVLEKREAALRWANHVSAEPEVGATWKYVLASESDIRAAKGSWSALKSLAS